VFYCLFSFFQFGFLLPFVFPLLFRPCFVPVFWFMCVRGKVMPRKSMISYMLVELHNPLSRATLVYCDSINVVYLSTNSVQHHCTKHVEIDLHFVRERVAIGGVCVLHILTTSQVADIFTKGLPFLVFSEFRSNLNIYSD
jgi:hypothetical protein